MSASTSSWPRRRRCIFCCLFAPSYRVVHSAFSNKLNVARLKVLQTRDVLVEQVRCCFHQVFLGLPFNARLQQVFQESKKTLASLTQNPEVYKKLLENLVLQGPFQLMETEAVIICRKADVALVKSVLQSASAKYKVAMKQDIKLTVSETAFLKDDRFAFFSFSFCFVF